MPAQMTIPAEYWPWIAIICLGLFHGINPAMGWLFAVALGLHRQSQRVVLASLIPIAIGHAVAVSTVIIAVVMLGAIVDTAMRSAGVVLLGYAGWHALSGHRQRMRIGMQTGIVGLFLWSFLIANAHGAGLMLIPTLMPVCFSASPAGELTASSSFPIAVVVIGVHTAAMIAMIAVTALAVYRWVGLAFLRRGWVNLDLAWTVALGACGILLLAR
jgi:hypothetical protein